MRCIKWFLDLDKEERWLNEMAKKGYLFRSTNCFGYYDFECIDEKECNAVVKTDFRIFKSYKEFDNYIALFEDSGWKHVWGTQAYGTQYFVKRNADASEDIFSDYASKVGKYKRVAMMWISLASAYIPVFIVNFMNFDSSQIFSFKSLYITPGLWEMKGLLFWRQFLIETPFVMMRGIGHPIFITILFLLYIIVCLLIYTKYRKAVKKLNNL